MSLCATAMHTESTDCHRLSGPEREKDESDKMKPRQYFSLPLWPNRGHEPGVTVRKKKKKSQRENKERHFFFKDLSV